MLVANNVESLMAERTDRIMGLGTRNNSNAENMFDMLHDANMIGLDVQKRPLINSEGHEHSNLFELTHVDPKLANVLFMTVKLHNQNLYL